VTSVGDHCINLNYPTASVNEPRWGYGRARHPLLYEIIDRGRKDYQEVLHRFLNYKDKYLAISRREDDKTPLEPHLTTPWLPGLDSLALYSMLPIREPATYIEIGSGSSTKFARRSIRDNSLETEVVSIDSAPRGDIDAICDQVLRKPLEEVDCSFFDQLEANDILFVDSSHRCFMNSDVTVIFLDVLPRLRPGVVVEIHDVFLPDDYPPSWAQRYYRQQYLLAAYILAEGQGFDVLLPNGFFSKDPQLHETLSPIFSAPDMSGVRSGGGSFWLRMK